MTLSKRIGNAHHICDSSWGEEYSNMTIHDRRTFVIRAAAAASAILHDPEAMQHWSRTYEKGWEPHI